MRRVQARPEGQCHCDDCHGDCQNPIQRNWWQCRPCTLKYHAFSCQQFTPDEFPTIQLGCKTCGYEFEEHYLAR